MKTNTLELARNPRAQLTPRSDPAPNLRNETLHAGQHPALGRYVFSEDENAAAVQHAPDLAKARRAVRDRTEHEARDDGVEAGIGEGQTLGHGLDQLDPCDNGGQPPRRLPKRAVVAIDGDHATFAVVPKASPASTTDL